MSVVRAGDVELVGVGEAGLDGSVVAQQLLDGRLDERGLFF
ncbi:MAG TPA: hypothetical protein VFR69_03690 [Rubrobacteraceae bacterium]|nr:hypothetical protein [Rubrobacteraceae bacterium]